MNRKEMVCIEHRLKSFDNFINTALKGQMTAEKLSRIIEDIENQAYMEGLAKGSVIWDDI